MNATYFFWVTNELNVLKICNKKKVWSVFTNGAHTNQPAELLPRKDRSVFFFKSKKKIIDICEKLKKFIEFLHIIKYVKNI